ncbi:ectonucleoside triphosphate diphosphohydrolase 6-like [Anguilla anguilla]|uniref:ectonucleoside triphosphate diphosphohydrolase 6-like n=1 Tax=Anguilla anguilla TaxID=7936 RepID=UPI0015AECC9A|nr:ectonucleoside triphosphate diphosphohydrolase 6-like [Anguilla anguilla]
MDGKDEGTAAWITINFLIDKLNGPDESTVGVLDLGGGSMQITFTPQDPNQKSTQTSPIIPLQMFNHPHRLHSRSYLGLGLMSARLAILGGVEGQPQGGTEMVSPCLAPESSVQWNHAGVDYTVKGQKAVPGKSIYESCHEKAEQVLSSKNVETIKEAKGTKDFYAFSYYYDRAVDIGVIAENKEGAIKVNDYIEAAKEVCNSMAKAPPKHPFLCLDLTYISVLLQGLGFPKDKELKLVKKIKGKDTSWALGATLLDMNSQST